MKFLKRIIKLIIFLIIILIIYFKVTETKGVVVCLDPGHGGNDVGAILEGENRYEKEDNLKVAISVKKYLEEKNVKVIMTREKDGYVSLQERCIKANKSKANLFVSIHRNSAESGNGIEIWVNNNENVGEIELATNIMKKLEKTNIQSNRGVKFGTIEGNTTNYYVNRNTKMPSCLIELGFITDITDNKLLDENIEEYAKAIAEGIYASLQQ